MAPNQNSVEEYIRTRLAEFELLSVSVQETGPRRQRVASLAQPDSQGGAGKKETGAKANQTGQQSNQGETKGKSGEAKPKVACRAWSTDAGC